MTEQTKQESTMTPKNRKKFEAVYQRPPNRAERRKAEKVRRSKRKKNG